MCKNIALEAGPLAGLQKLVLENFVGVIITILPDFVFDIFTFFLANFPAFNFRAFFVDKKATYYPLCVCCQKIIILSKLAR